MPEDIVIADIGDHALDIFLYGPESTHKNGIGKTFTPHIHSQPMCVVCDSFFLLSLFVTLYIFLHLTVMHSSTFGKGWVGRYECMSFGSFSLRELSCMHCVYLAL